MILFSWIEESLIESKLHNYLYVEGHIIARSIIRVTYIFVLFGLGYIGLKTLKLRWVLLLYIVWYVVILVISGIRIIAFLLFGYKMPINVWDFLFTFYGSALTPFPYIFLLLLYFLSGKKNK